MMTSVFSTTEYRTLIYFDGRFDPKVILINMLLMQRNSAPDASMCPVRRHNWACGNRGKMCIFEKDHWHCIKCGISNSFIYFLFIYFNWWAWKYIKACTIIRIQALCVVIPFKFEWL